MEVHDEQVKRAIDAVDADWALACLRRAVATPSLTGQEAAIAKLFEAEMRGVGLDSVARFDFAPERPNVWGRLAGSDPAAPKLMLVGHTDTVDVAGWREAWRDTEREDPHGAAVVDGNVWGRGAADMKAGLVAALAAVRAVRQAGPRPRGDLLLAFVGDEESGVPGLGRSEGMKALVARIAAGEIPRPDFVVYAEPTTLDVYTAQIGFLIADVVVTGKSAYFGLPWQGVDALKGAHKLLTALFAYSNKVWQRDDHPLLGRAFNLVTSIEGGGYIAVPDRCRLSMIRKILPSESVEAVRGEIEGIVHLLTINEGVQAEVSFPAGRDTRSGGRPSEVATDAPPVQALLGAIQAATGDEGRVAGAPFWAEASFFVHNLGVPAVYFGPGDIGVCHTFEERVEVDQLVAAAKALAATVVAFCGAD